MRRRRLLALGAAAAGFTGYEWGFGSTDDTMDEGRSPPERAAEGTARSDGADRARPATPSIGGTLNGRAHRLGDDLALLEKSETTWLHAFLDVREKYERDVSPRDDPDVEALQRAKREAGVKLIVTLKWNFTGNFDNVEPTSVPPPGSSRRTALFEYAAELLTAIDEPVDAVVLGNEPIWETRDAEVKGSDQPLIPFTRDLKDHLVDGYAGDPRFLVGAFNRLYGDHVRKEYRRFHRRLLRLARDDDDIDGIDLHVHYDGFRQAEAMLATAREMFPDGTVTATEFCPVWRYDRNKDAAIGAFAGGDRFANRHDVSPDTTVAEYFEAAKDSPRSPDEMAEFMETMPWYNVNFVGDMYDLLDEYDVEVGTTGFLQDTGARHADWTTDWTPFQINCLFQRAVLDTADGAHPHYLDAYRERT